MILKRGAILEALATNTATVKGQEICFINTKNKKNANLPIKNRIPFVNRAQPLFETIQVGFLFFFLSEYIRASRHVYLKVWYYANIVLGPII
jgi:hypothetical protein